MSKVGNPLRPRPYETWDFTWMFQWAFVVLRAPKFCFCTREKRDVLILGVVPSAETHSVIHEWFSPVNLQTQEQPGGLWSRWSMGSRKWVLQRFVSSQASIPSCCGWYSRIAARCPIQSCDICTWNCWGQPASCVTQRRLLSVSRGSWWRLEAVVHHLLEALFYHIPSTLCWNWWDCIWTP